MEEVHNSISQNSIMNSISQNSIMTSIIYAFSGVMKSIMNA
uniref:Uncharacterized protein n=1 Tax=Picea glauca TaxID=3330 RepID=A0A101LVB0_PICGL|nr:hypothetical protein ABT39_MTgene2093 [Picea glauca]